MPIFLAKSSKSFRSFLDLLFKMAVSIYTLLQVPTTQNNFKL
jgi:hypothetical protein